MAYNRWLSSQYSYTTGTDLMHYGRKGMRWGKHVFGLPEITLNGGGGGIVDPEELEKLLKEGKITLDEFKARANKILQDDVAANKEGFKQVKDKLDQFYKKFSDTYKNVRSAQSDTYENFKSFQKGGAGMNGRYNPEVSKDDQIVYEGKTGTYMPYSKRERARDAESNKEYKKKVDAQSSAESRARTESKIQDRKGQESRDRKENLERKRAERASAPRKVSKSSNQNAASKTMPKDSYSLEDIVKLAFGSASTSGSSSSGSTRTPNQNKEPKKETYDVTAKQKKIYQTIGKFLNYALTVTNPYHSLRKGLTKQR